MKISEPDFWQDKYELDDTPWDTGTTTPEIIKSINHSINKKICILGCGYSKDAIYLSEKGHKVFAVDFASSPIDYLYKLKKENHINNLFPVKENIFNLSLKYSNFFDIVIEYTCFCAIPKNKRKNYIDVVSSILYKKAVCLALFFPTKKPTKESSGPPFHVNIDTVLPMFEEKFKIINFNPNPDSIKPRIGNEVFVEMQKL